MNTAHHERSAPVHALWIRCAWAGAIVLAASASAADLRAYNLPAEQDICSLYHARIQGADLLVAPAGQHVYLYAYQDCVWTNVARLNSPYGDISTLRLAPASSNRFVSSLATGDANRHIAFHDLVNISNDWTWVAAGQASLPADTTQSVSVLAISSNGAIVARLGDSQAYLARMGGVPLELVASQYNNWRWTPAGWLLASNMASPSSITYCFQLYSFQSGALLITATNQMCFPDGGFIVAEDGLWLLNVITGRVLRLAWPDLVPDRTLQVSSNPVCALLSDPFDTVWVTVPEGNPDDRIYQLLRYDAEDMPGFSMLTVYPFLWRASESRRFLLAYGGGQWPSAHGVLYNADTGATMTRFLFSDSGPAVDALLITTPDGSQFAVKACSHWDGLQVQECDVVAGPWQDPQRQFTDPARRVLDFGTVAMGASSTLTVYVSNTTYTTCRQNALTAALPPTSSVAFFAANPRNLLVPTNGLACAVTYAPTTSGTHFAALCLEWPDQACYDEFLLQGQTPDAGPPGYSPVMITDARANASGGVHIACTSDSGALTNFVLMTGVTLFDVPVATTSSAGRTTHFCREFSLPAQGDTEFLRVNATADWP